MKIAATLLLLLMAVQLTQAREAVVEIIQVNNRPAAELQPLLAPLLEPEDQIVANGDNLIVRTLPERVSVIKNLIRQLDSPVHNLQISVMQSREITAEQLNAGLGGRIEISGQGAPVNGGFGGNFQQYQRQGNFQNTQTLRTQEGMPAHIQAGNAFPVTTYSGYPNGYGYSETAPSTRYYEATTGFAVTPRLSGAQVTLEVAPWSDRLTENGQIDTQGTETTIRANLGEWVEIGGVDENSRTNGRGIVEYNNAATTNRMRILIKVEKVN